MERLIVNLGKWFSRSTLDSKKLSGRAHTSYQVPDLFIDARSKRGHHINVCKDSVLMGRRPSSKLCYKLCHVYAYKTCSSLTKDSMPGNQNWFMPQGSEDPSLATTGV